MRVELLEKWPSHAESQQYIRFLEDTGAEYLGSNMRWAYFRKKTEKGTFNLFSDNRSRIRHLNRILLLIGIVGGMDLVVGFGYLISYFVTGNSFGLGGSIPTLLLGALIGYGFLRLCLKQRRMKKEARLFE